MLRGASDPHLRLADAEDVCQCGRNVELHHAVCYYGATLDAFSGDDKRRFHLLHGLATVTFVDSAVVGSDDEYGVVGHAGIVDSFDDFADVTIDHRESLKVLGRAVTVFVALMVGAGENDAHESRLGVADVVDSGIGDATWIFL